MPKFPVPFGRRRSTADSLDNGAVAEPTFRVLDRNEVSNGKSFDGGARMAAKGHALARASVSNISVEDNIFANLNTNRGSGSSNTTKTMSTDNSSRYSNASTAPSSTDAREQEDAKGGMRRSQTDMPLPPLPKSSSNFLKAAGRTFSFGGQKKNNVPPPAPLVEEPIPPVPATPQSYVNSGRSRATTESTTSTATPPRLDEEFNMDMGGDFGKMLTFDKRQSVMTLRGDDPAARQALAPRSLTGNRLAQPAPLQIDKSSRIEPSPFSWGSHHSNDQLLNRSPTYDSPTNENAPPVPRHASPAGDRPQIPISASDGGILKRASAIMGRRRSATESGDGDDEDSRLLKDLSAASRFLASGPPPVPSHSGRYRRDEDSFSSTPSWRQVSSESRLTSTSVAAGEEDNLFSTSRPTSNRSTPQRTIPRKPAPQKQQPQQHKVMTPAEFERYRQDKERQGARSEAASSEHGDDRDEDDEDHYEDDEDEIEKTKQAAKQRRKQEAHMAVYRQQMMKVTGETGSAGPSASRPSMQTSFSTPNLPNMVSNMGPSPKDTSEGSEEDEEVPLAILAAHGFPNKNRPPTRLTTMMSNPNLRETAQQPSYQRPGSAMGEAGGSSRLPAFARKLPQDPFLGAGLVNGPPRESLAFGAGAPAAVPQAGPAPPGGLVGVIANEERSRALRRGSPNIEANKPLPSMGTQQFDPMAGIPPQMMYPQMQGMGNPMMLTPGDQAQIQMNQQMQQFMQMQMQFMQMMATNGSGGQAQQPPQGRPMSHMPTASMGSMGSMGPPMLPQMGGMGMGQGMGMGMGPGPGPDMMRHSFMDTGSVADMPMGRQNDYGRTMSMVQPSSASWIQPQGAGYAPSIRVVGANGYAPSIAPSERSNVGLPGRYRPVSQAPPPSAGGAGEHSRKSSLMSGGLGGGLDQPPQQRKASPSTSPLNRSNNASDDEDDEQGWAAMKAKREKKRSLWRTKKDIDSDIGALIS
ncbi:uncharacterized protein E0L32_003117 [Thyridium curvatum]|uniref:Uncharacterized protein n=1 Tax=Thyridium curvatum TaxID=1093900 RepID=A0A507BFD4_9PEZI|nr:uncharacterized protein E0L32_003117 [Thyridium curvatum]TPX17474.1 hypothetical protein E0L32_003117 [Thyridium curvatum]